MNDIMKMIDSPEELGLLIKAKQLAKQLKIKQKNKKVGFADCYYVHQVLVNQEIYQQVKAQSEQAIATIQGREANMPGRGTIRADQSF